MASARGPADGTHVCSQGSARFFQGRHRCQLVSCGLLGSGGVAFNQSDAPLANNSCLKTHATMKHFFKKFKSLFTNVDEKP